MPTTDEILAQADRLEKWAQNTKAAIFEHKDDELEQLLIACGRDLLGMPAIPPLQHVTTGSDKPLDARHGLFQERPVHLEPGRPARIPLYNRDGDCIGFVDPPKPDMVVHLGNGETLEHYRTDPRSIQGSTLEKPHGTD